MLNHRKSGEKLGANLIYPPHPHPLVASVVENSMGIWMDVPMDGPIDVCMTRHILKVTLVRERVTYRDARSIDNHDG